MMDKRDSSFDYSSINKISMLNSKVMKGYESWIFDKDNQQNSTAKRETNFATIFSSKRKDEEGNGKNNETAYKVLFTETEPNGFKSNKMTEFREAKSEKEEEKTDILFTPRMIEIREIEVNLPTEKRKKTPESRRGHQMKSEYTTGGSKNFRRPSYRKKYEIPDLVFSRSLTRERKVKLKRSTISKKYSYFFFNFFKGNSKKLEEVNIKKLAFEIDKAYFKSFSPKKFKGYKKLVGVGKKYPGKKVRKLAPMEDDGIENALGILKSGLI